VDEEEDDTHQEGKRAYVKLDSVGTLYYVPSAPKTPSWLTKFFGTGLPKLELFTSIAKAALLVRVDVGTETRVFAVCFGHGYLLLNQAAWEERFGLRTVLNVIDQNNLRRIDKKSQSSMPKDAHEQVSQASSIAAFGIDVEQDLVRGIAGESKDGRFGTIVSGKDALSVSVPLSAMDLPAFLGHCYERYLSEDYKEHFAWIDHIEEVRDPSILASLDGRMIERLKSEGPGTLWMAVPDLIDWTDVAGFKYSMRVRNPAPVQDDIQLQDFLAGLRENERESLDINMLRQRRVYCLSASLEKSLRSWTIYNCIYCEEIDTTNGNVYLLSNSKWYEVEGDYARQVNGEYQRFRDLAPTCTLPVYDPKDDPDFDEGHYNEGVAGANAAFALLDGPRYLVQHGGSKGSVEICDLYSNKNQFIHVKRYGSSRVLSHLFSQGVVPAELFLVDPSFRAKVNAKLPPSHQIKDTAAAPVPGEYEVVYAIVSSKKEPLEIPFFSKVALRSAIRQIAQLYRYRVSMLKVETIDAS